MSQPPATRPLPGYCNGRAGLSSYRAPLMFNHRGRRHVP
jgi:hypothetical protein